MALEDMWDGIVEELEYLISFEWFSDVGEFFSGLFENIGEFSFVGILYGFVLAILVFLFRKSVFVMIPNIFLQIIFYAVAFFMGYIMGKRLWGE